MQTIYGKQDAIQKSEDTAMQLGRIAFSYPILLAGILLTKDFVYDVHGS